MSQFIDEIPPDVISPHESIDKDNIDQPLKHLDTVIALYDFPGTQPSHLPLNLGDTIYVLSKSETGWWDGVIISSNGDLLRGWFPHNFVRSVNYVQPVLNKLKLNKEIDSITAANTAANVLIPSFTHLLQKNLLDSEKNSPSASVRKNSVVSFASSETSISSDSKTSTSENISTNATTPNLPHYQLIQHPQTHIHSSDHSQSTGSVSSSVNHSSISHTLTSGDRDIVFTSLTDAEKLSEEYKLNTNHNIVWLPRLTAGGDVVFFCEQLSIYCESIPLSPFVPNIDINGGNIEFPSNQALLDNAILPNDSNFSSDPHFESNNNLSNQNNNNINDSITTTNENENDTTNNNDGATNLSTKSFDPFKRDSNASSVGSQTSGGDSYHHFSQPFFSMNDLFYKHTTDITYWTELKERFNYLLDLSFKALKEHNKQLFSTHFTSLTKIVSIVASASRLIQDDFINTKYEKSVRRKLKRIASSYAQVYINGILHLSFMHYSQKTSDAQLFSIDISKLNKSTSIPSNVYQSQRNNSSISTIYQDTNEDSTSTTTSNLTSQTGNLNQLNMSSNDDDNIINYFQQIELEVESLRLNLNSLTKIILKLTKDKKVRKSDYNNSDTSDDESGGEDRYNVLPQVYPRFITDEFNGGNWCNPFFTTKNHVLNASGDDLKNRYHLKVIIDKEAYDSVKKSTDEMIKLSKETLDYLAPEIQHQFYNDNLKNERNTQILRLIYKYLFHASSTIDLIESFDFTVFCLIKRYSSNEEIDTDHLGEKASRSSHSTSDTEFNNKNNDKINNNNQIHSSDSITSSTMNSINSSAQNNNNNLDSNDQSTKTLGESSNLTFDYPVVLEFFQFKQIFHNLISNIVMSTQSLTVQDPDVFKGMKEDDPLFYNRDILKIPTEKAAMVLSNILAKQSTQSRGESISLNPDSLMSTILTDGIKFFDSILKIIQQLIEERETILNYATRVMHDDFNVQLLLIERNNTISSEKSEDGHLYYTGKKQTNVPWYLEGDEEYDLLMDVKGSIKGGTKEALIAHLTHHDLFDSNFNTAFLLTFASIMSIGEFIGLLINRFNIEAPEGLSYEEYNLWIAKKQNPIRLRVMNIMKLLVEKHWSISYYNENVLKKWIKFASSSPVQSFSIGKVLSKNLTRLLNGDVICREREPSIPDFRPPAPLTKGLSMKKMKLLDIDYVELARQLTLMEFKYYSKITKLACLSKVWGKKSGLNENIDQITKFIKASNQLTNFVAFMILRKPDPKKRVQVIRYFVQVAEKCRQYNNFSSMTAIISALYSSPIHRLKKTWKYVSPDTSAHLQNMNKLMNSSRNFNEYRDVLKFVGSEPCVPFFGVYLSDLTFVYHGNPDFLMNRSKMINFSKRAKTCEIVLGIDRFKSTGYNLQEVPDIQKFLNLWFGKCPTIEEQYQISLNLEPREVVQVEPNANHSAPTSNFRPSKTSLGTFNFK